MDKPETRPPGPAGGIPESGIGPEAADRASDQASEGGASQAQAARNRLARELSPYLLQHAGNPVDWYPWGEEAFERARADDKPIWLSIGYATCHWCHVMERESFEDESVAALMNDAFVNIKVDREERPDIDAVYMTVCQMISQSCGWPLNVVLTPDGEPFFATTYVPRDSRFGRRGMTELVPHIAGLWSERRDEIVGAAADFKQRLVDVSAGTSGDELGRAALDTATGALVGAHDGAHGGFGRAPKFPTPHNLSFLLRQWRRTGDEALLEIVESTLRAMRRGGVFDHVGRGFHRYSTDREWRLPHFEKMLYDQALLTLAYVEAFQATGHMEHATTAREIIDYVQRDMTSPEGGFYSAEDADSEGEEGRFYVWTESELREVLGDEDYRLVEGVFDVKPGGNFADEATGRRTGANVLHMPRGLEDAAARLGVGTDAIRDRLEPIRRQLLERRAERVRPLLDDKILTDWNGLMIAALAKAGAALDEQTYVEAAERAAAFVIRQMRCPDGRLLHRYRAGESGIAATLDDYAFLTWGLLELYEATGDASHLAAALELTDAMIDRFWDEDGGGFFLTAADAEELVVRPKETYDGAVPSGNSVAMLNMLRLARMTGRSDLEQRAAALSRAFGAGVTRAPASHAMLLSAVDFGMGPAREIVVVGDPAGPDTGAMLRRLRREYLPNAVLAFRPVGGSSAVIDALAPYVSGQEPVDERATAYVCEDHVCHEPTTDVEKALGQLRS
ncbi:MAG: thioredoxin domain-containing protein [Anaerolineae bacterium]